MGKFSKIKKYSKPSLSVDEKIDKLNQELKKTGMLSEITNSTSGVYTITQYIDVAAVPAVPAVPPTYSNTIIGYRIVIPDGGNLICNVQENPCTGISIIKSGESKFNPTSASDVPGPLQFLTYKPILKTSVNAN